MRDETESKVANHIYRESRRPIRPKIVMVPSERKITREESIAIALGRKPKRNTTRATVVYPQPRRLTWKEARARAKAYVRVLEGLPKWPSAKEAEMLRRETSARPKKIERFKRVTGMWWLDKFADAVDRRVAPTQPSYGSGAGARKRAKATRQRLEVGLSLTTKRRARREAANGAG